MAIFNRIANQGALFVFLIIIISGWTLSPQLAFANDTDITICHATADVAHPYTTLTVLESEVMLSHDGHSGDVWTKDVRGTWGDIIPPFKYSGGTYLGKNWSVEGKRVWNANCSTAGTVTVTKVVNNGGGGTAQVSDFQLFVGEMSTESGRALKDVPLGTYTVNEIGNMDGYEARFSGDCASDGTITVVPLCAFSCTITNTFTGTSTTGTTTPSAPIFGCVDPTAENYDPLAAKDDGSCTYSETGEVTPPTGGNGGGSEVSTGGTRHGGGKKIELGPKNPHTESMGQGGSGAGPEGEVLGDEITIPTGAPNTGAGGTSRSHTTILVISLLGVALALIVARWTRNV